MKNQTYIYIWVQIIKFLYVLCLDKDIQITNMGDYQINTLKKNDKNQHERKQVATFHIGAEKKAKKVSSISYPDEDVCWT